MVDFSKLGEMALEKGTKAFLTPDGHILIGDSKLEFHHLLTGVPTDEDESLLNKALGSGYIPLVVDPDDQKNPSRGGVILKVYGSDKARRLVQAWVERYPTWVLSKKTRIPPSSRR